MNIVIIIFLVLSIFCTGWIKVNDYKTNFNWCAFLTLIFYLIKIFVIDK